MDGSETTGSRNQRAGQNGLANRPKTIAQWTVFEGIAILIKIPVDNMRPDFMLKFRGVSAIFMDADPWLCIVPTDLSACLSSVLAELFLAIGPTSILR